MAKDHSPGVAGFLVALQHLLSINAGDIFIDIVKSSLSAGAVFLFVRFLSNLTSKPKD